jgi:UDP-N-acetylmuramoyl-tripeptide--D-alanyl-D-alanine ligase
VLLPGPRGSRIIDDTYNASTPSMLSALNYLGELPAERKIAVLGDMRELGAISEREHRVVGRRAAEVADVVITFGELARTIADEAKRIDARVRSVTSFGLDQRFELTEHLLAELRPGDIALLKGSRGLEMETMVTALRAMANAGIAE